MSFIKEEIVKMVDIDGSTVYVSLYTVKEFLVNLTFHRLEENKTLMEISPEMIPNHIKQRWIRRINMRIFEQVSQQELKFYKKEKEKHLKSIRKSVMRDKELGMEYDVVSIFEVAGFYASLLKEKSSEKYILSKLALHQKGYNLDIFPTSSVDLLIVQLIPLLKGKEKAYHIQINNEILLGIKKTKDIYFCQVAMVSLEMVDEKPMVKNTTSLIYKLKDNIYYPATKEELTDKLLAEMEPNGVKILDEILSV